MDLVLEPAVPGDRGEVKGRDRVTYSVGSVFFFDVGKQRTQVSISKLESHCLAQQRKHAQREEAVLPQCS